MDYFLPLDLSKKKNQKYKRIKTRKKKEIEKNKKIYGDIIQPLMMVNTTTDKKSLSSRIY
jgi:hypothetical protein